MFNIFRFPYKKEGKHDIPIGVLELTSPDNKSVNVLGFNKKSLHKGERKKYSLKGSKSEEYLKRGFLESGIHKNGTYFDDEGFAIDGFNKNGIDRDGYNRGGYNEEGYDREGFNREGFSEEGYDRNGYDILGYNKEGFNKDGRDKLGYDKLGYDLYGYNQYGVDKEGYSKEGFDRRGYSRDGFNKEGYDINGYDVNGYDIMGYDVKGFDMQGFDKQGYNKYGEFKEFIDFQLKKNYSTYVINSKMIYTEYVKEILLLLKLSREALGNDGIDEVGTYLRRLSLRVCKEIIKISGISQGQDLQLQEMIELIYKKSVMPVKYVDTVYKINKLDNSEIKEHELKEYISICSNMVGEWISKINRTIDKPKT